jgi:hypothetical protein
VLALTVLLIQTVLQVIVKLPALVTLDPLGMKKQVGALFALNVVWVLMKQVELALNVSLIRILVLQDKLPALHVLRIRELEMVQDKLPVVVTMDI